MKEKNKKFVHFETNKITIYEVQNKQIDKTKKIQGDISMII